jgi:hypothetical protein
LFCTTVLYLYPTYAERKGALSSSIVLHSSHPAIYNQR